MIFLAITTASWIAGIYVGYDLEVCALAEEALKAFALAFVLQGFNIYAAAYFTGLNNGKISAAIALSRTFLFQTLAIFGLPLIFGPESLWICQAVAEVFAAAIAIFMLYTYRHDYLGDKT